MLNIRENVPLSPLTTMGVGGPARWFAEASSESEVREAVDFAVTRQLPLFVLGGGSNLVVSDAGWPGMCLRIAILGMNQNGRGRYEVGAGEDWDGFVAAAVEAGFGGLECLSGIPGTVGGTPVQNVGAYGQEVSETIVSVRVLDLRSGATGELSNAECAFAYRTSLFNNSERGRYIVLRVSFRLKAGATPHIEYADLKRYFSSRSGVPSLQETRQAVREIRRSKAMLLVEGDPDVHSAGSFFKNPVISEAQFQLLNQRPALNGKQIPSYPAGDGLRKVSAAWLVENAGFHKGYTRGNAGISSKHTLAIVNRGAATAADIIALKDEIQRGVLESFGIALHPEPVFLGF